VFPAIVFEGSCVQIRGPGGDLAGQTEGLSKVFVAVQVVREKVIKKVCGRCGIGSSAETKWLAGPVGVDSGVFVITSRYNLASNLGSLHSLCL